MYEADKHILGVHLSHIECVRSAAQDLVGGFVLAPAHYRRSKIEKFMELLISKRNFYANKAGYYKSIPGNSAVDNTRLWEENRVKSDIYDEILKELIHHFELDPTNHTERPKTSEGKS